MNLLIPGIVTGLLLFVALLWVEKKLMKAFQINPLLELGLIYVAFYWLPDLVNKFLPPLWKEETIDTPIQLIGTLGFILRLNKPQMSVVDVAFSVFIICIIGRFIYVMGGKKSMWGRMRHQRKEEEL